MLSSLFSTLPPADPSAPTFHPVSSKLEAADLFGSLDAKDTEWLCAGGFATETQIFYSIADDGRFLMCQVIHSSVGLWYPTIQFTCKIHNPKTQETTWKSLNVSNFVTPPSGLDRRSSKADEFSITHKLNPGTEYPESYTIRANLSADLQVSLDVKRPVTVPGYKIGKGSKGGYSYFGTDPEKAEGYVIHRFWPLSTSSGHIIQKGHATPFQGLGMFVHAIQGMRPNLVASAWNFAYFQSEQYGGTTAIQMEFTTPKSYGRKGTGSGGVVVNLGSLVVGGKLASVTAETKWADEELPERRPVMSRATHLQPLKDSDTGYEKPTEILFQWAGPSLLPDAQGTIQAKLHTDLGDIKHPKGLVEKVDVLAEIPKVVKMALNYVAGTKPYIYQWMNPAILSITGPEALLPGLSKGIEIDGLLYNEATFISNS